MAEHKHAQVLRAIADGVPRSEFEIICAGWKAWESLQNFGSWVYCPDDWEIRRKQQCITVNGFNVPKPLDVMPKEGKVFSPHVGRLELFEDSIARSEWAARVMERKCAHSTKEAAIAHAKAMLGIDPEAA